MILVAREEGVEWYGNAVSGEGAGGRERREGSEGKDISTIWKPTYMYIMYKSIT